MHQTFGCDVDADNGPTNGWRFRSDNQHLPNKKFDSEFSQLFPQASIVQENLVALKASRGRKSDYVSANLSPQLFLQTIKHPKYRSRL